MKAGMLDLLPMLKEYIQHLLTLVFIVTFFGNRLCQAWKCPSNPFLKFLS